jgi:Ala-tRNA(Pro) deacylase
MMPKKLEKFLKEQKIKYEVIAHKTVFTAYDTAATLKRKLNEVAKTLVVKVEPGIEYGKKTANYVLVVLPASLRLDLQKLKRELKVKKIEIVKEKVMTKVMKFKPGAIPPFSLFAKIPTYIDRGMLKAKSVIVSAGTYTESLKMKGQDLIKAGGKAVGSFGKVASSATRRRGGK